MLYVRGQPLDYDTWGQLGNRGLVVLVDPALLQEVGALRMDCDDSRGKGGLLNVADMSETHLSVDAFIDAAEASGFPRTRTTTTAARKASATTR
jgi:choline dehydrogenase